MKMVNMLPLVTVVRLVAAQMDPSAPGLSSLFVCPVISADMTTGCAVRCWENTQYVSKCFGDTACLCREENYQSVSWTSKKPNTYPALIIEIQN